MFNKVNWKRSLLKGFTWELIGVITLYLMTHNIVFSLLYIGIRIPMYVIHEFGWKQVKWMKQK